MTGQTADLVAYAFLALGCGGFFAFGCCLVYRITYAEHLTPEWVRELPAKARVARRDAALSAAALLLILTAPKGATS